MSTDLNGLSCKMIEEARLERVQPSSRPSAPSVRGDLPDRAHQLDGYECQLQDLNLTVLLTTLSIDDRDPPPHGVIDTTPAVNTPPPMPPISEE